MADPMAELGVRGTAEVSEVRETALFGVSAGIPDAGVERGVMS